MTDKWASIFPGKTSLYSAPSCLIGIINDKRLCKTRDKKSCLIGIINDKRLCKTRDKKSAPISARLNPVLIVEPKRYVQCLYQNKAVEHWYISIGMLFLNVCNLASGVQCSWVGVLVFNLGYPWSYRSAFIAKWVMLISISKFHTDVLKMKAFERVSVFRRLCSATTARFSLVYVSF